MYWRLSGAVKHIGPTTVGSGSQDVNLVDMTVEAEMFIMPAGIHIEKRLAPSGGLLMNQLASAKLSGSGTAVDSPESGEF